MPSRRATVNVTIKLGPFHVLSEQEPHLTSTCSHCSAASSTPSAPDRCMWETDVGGPVPMAEPEEVYAATVELVLEHADFSQRRGQGVMCCTGRRRGCCLKE